jgi:hypothetical protein
MTQHQTPAIEPASGSSISVPALRSRASKHPMALFSVVAAVALLSISAPWQAIDLSMPSGASNSRDAGSEEAQKPARSEIELACDGQVWGSETPLCLLAIAKDGGKDVPARIRTISGA